jgi:hypothetical protein
LAVLTTNLRQLDQFRRNRSYWELRAEQIMDRVFEPLDGTATRQKTINTTSIENPKSTPVVELKREWKLTTPIALLVGLSLASFVAVGFSLMLWRSWMQAREDLHQERQLLVLERLRQLGPISAPNPSLTPAPVGAIAELPIQLGEENSSWIEAPAPIRVPLPSPSPAAQEQVPELLGVVQVPGKGGTAIFNTATGSVTAATGENIGKSGWQLQSVTNDQAQISRQGVVRVVNLSNR